MGRFIGFWNNASSECFVVSRLNFLFCIYRRIPFIQGNLRLGLHAKAFEEKRSQQLSELYPVEEASGLRWLDLRSNESLPALGEKMARNILFYLKK